MQEFIRDIDGRNQEFGDPQRSNRYSGRETCSGPRLTERPVTPQQHHQGPSLTRGRSNSAKSTIAPVDDAFGRVDERLKYNLRQAPSQIDVEINENFIRCM